MSSAVGMAQKIVDVDCELRDTCDWHLMMCVRIVGLKQEILFIENFRKFWRYNEDQR